MHLHCRDCASPKLLASAGSRESHAGTGFYHTDAPKTPSTTPCQSPASPNCCKLRRKTVPLYSVGICTLDNKTKCSPIHNSRVSVSRRHSHLHHISQANKCWIWSQQWSDDIHWITLNHSNEYLVQWTFRIWPCVYYLRHGHPKAEIGPGTARRIMTDPKTFVVYTEWLGLAKDLVKAATTIKKMEGLTTSQYAQWITKKRSKKTNWHVLVQLKCRWNQG
jgi:hypothetical protein